MLELSDIGHKLISKACKYENINWKTLVIINDHPFKNIFYNLTSGTVYEITREYSIIL